MKRIVICFDGTWNKPADEGLPSEEQVETNVARFYKSVKEEGIDGTTQMKWYDQGVGSHWYDRFVGGGIGAGLETNIVEGYRFLVDAYDEGDELYVLGFSRGAYTARSLVGMLRNVGLVKRGLFSSARTWVGYGIYRTRDDGPDSDTARSFKESNSWDVQVKFLGVWDTVGALGIPLSLMHAANQRFYEFHDTNLSSIVENAYQAIAIDEHRGDYDVCLWDPPARPEQTIEQRWFLGAHSDVGGGYPDRRLSDISLRWIQDQARSLGLALDPRELAEKGFLAPCSDSYSQFLHGIYAQRKPRHYRKVKSTGFGNEVVDQSVALRRAGDSNYAPLNEGL